MSQTTLPELDQPVAAQTPDAAAVSETSRQPMRPGFREYEEFTYRTLPVIAVIGFVVAVLSAISMLVWIAIPLCMVGFLLCGSAFLTIRRNSEVYSGRLMALSGMVMSLLFMGVGLGYQVHLYNTEVPEGYERISFVKDISDKGFVQQYGQMTVHPDILKLDGKKIFLKGYIYQTGKIHGLTSFLLVKDNQSCCFGATPAVTDRMGVVMPEGKAIDYKAGKVAVAGTFRLNENFTNDDLDPLYLFDCDYFNSRISDF